MWRPGGGRDERLQGMRDTALRPAPALLPMRPAQGRPRLVGREGRQVKVVRAADARVRPDGVRGLVDRGLPARAGATMSGWAEPDTMALMRRVSDAFQAVAKARARVNRSLLEESKAAARLELRKAEAAYQLISDERDRFMDIRRAQR